jgi:A/G-specific adenine glycosylase
VAPLPAWYAHHGRHALPWRASRDRWSVLVSEVMLHQTQVARVREAFGPFLAHYPTPEAMAAVTPGDVIRAWGRLGYPRRALRLWETARVVARDGWPAELQDLPGVGRYTAAAIRAQADDADIPAVDVNIRRVAERVTGRRLTEREAEAASVQIGRPLQGRDRLLALMDIGAELCRPRDPRCGECPLRRRCASRGPLPGEVRSRQGRFEGSLRQRRGLVLAALRAGDAAPSTLDAHALESLVADGLAVVDGAGRARLP